MESLALANKVTYWIVFPILIILGVASSLIGVGVLRRPALQKLQFKGYFMMLSVCDLFFCLSLIPVSVSASGCIIHHYIIAKYFSHFGWPIPVIIHSQCVFLLYWMSLDRCLAVWYIPGYNFIQKPQVQLIRSIVVAVLVIGIHIPYIVDAGVKCHKNPSENTTNFEMYNEAVNGTGTENEGGGDQDCENGHWYTNDGFQKSFNEVWHTIFRWFYIVLIRWCPVVFLVVCDLSLVVGVRQGKIQAHVSVTKGEGQEGARAKTWERNLVATIIAMATSYLVLTLPITIYLTVYANAIDDSCWEPNPKESLRHVANVLQLLEHVLHTTFLAFYIPPVRREFSYILGLAKKSEQPQTMLPWG